MSKTRNVLVCPSTVGVAAEGDISKFHLGAIVIVVRKKPFPKRTSWYRIPVSDLTIDQEEQCVAQFRVQRIEWETFPDFKTTMTKWFEITQWKSMSAIEYAVSIFWPLESRSDEPCFLVPLRFFEHSVQRKGFLKWKGSYRRVSRKGFLKWIKARIHIDTSDRKSLKASFIA